MSGFISKIARFAASKAAAFTYAVMVGVAGNVAFHFVQPHDATPIPVVATLPPAAAPADDKAPIGPLPAVVIAPRAAPASPIAAPASTHALPPAAPARAAVPVKTAAPPIVLPEPPAATAALPGPDSLPAPALKPAALPSEAAIQPAPSPVAEPTPAAPPAAPATVAALPPLSPPIEVTAPPTPPAEIASAPARVEPPRPVPTVKTATARMPQNSLELSDIWHPGRAVEKSLHWAGRQLPLIGDADAEPHPKAAAPVASTAPIPLLPSTAEATAPGRSESPPRPGKPTAPGPGSGGLY